MSADATGAWVVVLAAFVGGLVGAILQPLLSYVLERMRATETIRKDRERSLRRMIFAQIRQTRRVQAWAAGRLDRKRLDPSLTGDSPPIGGPFWEPDRIKDVELRSSVGKYNAAYARLYGAGWDNDEEQIQRIDAELNEQQVAITRRMDELNFPEADLEDV